MKNSLLLFLFLLSQFCFAQNLVPNPSFENYINCPTNLNQIYQCQDWHNWGYFPDYFNSCSTNPQVSVPNNYYGFQNPSSGNAYAAFLNHHVPAPLNDFLGAQLLQPLVIGQTYYVSLKISFVAFSCPTNKMGVLFSTLPFDSIHPPPLNDFAHVYTDTIVNDTANWFQIKGSFIADSNYSHIIIGNFFNNPATNIFCGNIWSSWYYVDEVCVSTDSMTCNSIPTGVEQKSSTEIKVFPNPSSDILNLSFPTFGDAEVSIYDRLGRRVFSATVRNQHTLTLNLGAFSPRVYLLKLVSEKDGRVVVRKVVKL